PVPPRALPPVSLEQDLKHSRGIGCVRGADRPAIEDYRQFAVIRNNAVIGEAKDVRLPWAQYRIDLASLRPSPASDFLNFLLDGFDEGHVQCPGPPFCNAPP